MSATISPEAKEFLKSHELAVLSTLSREGQIQGATVYYHFADGFVYVLSKSESSKVHNMMAHPEVAVTIYDADAMKTVQMQGEAHIEADLETKRLMFNTLVKPRNYQGEMLMPPVTELSAGGFILFRITPTKITYVDYKENR